MNTTKKTSQTILLGLAATLLSACASRISEPQAILPVPEQKQIDWQEMETYAFVHFGLNTFNDREWGYGDSDPSTFNPKRLDCEQWVRTFKASGMKGVILTAKHHDGFCLWPTQLTEYCIRNTPYKNGKGDIVSELSAACRKHGIKFAVYLSPWDRHQANYGTPAYVEYFHQQLRDLMENYGNVFEVWFDGANGGDGWYGGAKESRTIDRRNYYNYPRIYEMLDSLQPQAVIFSDGGPGCRWVGNENGFAGATNWSFLRRGEVYPGYPKYRELQFGHADGNQWVPAECDVSIRPGWFYHPEEDGKVKSVEQLTDLYYRSVGHNATLLLNFPVDRNGLVNPVDSANAVNFHKRIQQELSHNILYQLAPKVSNERGGKFRAKALTDGKKHTYWATEDGVTSATITFTLPRASRVNRLMLQEYIRLGQRIKAFNVEWLDGDKWQAIDPKEETTTVGYKRLLRFPSVTTTGIRIHIADARGPICLSNIEAFYADETITGGVDAKAEKIKSLPLSLPRVAPSEALKATDRKAATTCFIEGNSLLIDLGSEQNVSTFHYLPDQSPYNKGLIARYEIATSTSANTQPKLVAAGEFSNIKHNPILQSVSFKPIKARYITIRATKMVDPSADTMGFAEIGVE